MNRSNHEARSYALPTGDPTEPPKADMIDQNPRMKDVTLARSSCGDGLTSPHDLQPLSSPRHSRWPILLASPYPPSDSGEMMAVDRDIAYHVPHRGGYLRYIHGIHDIHGC